MKSTHKFAFLTKLVFLVLPFSVFAQNGDSETLPEVKVSAQESLDKKNAKKSKQWSLEREEWGVAHKESLSEIAYGIPGTRISLNGTGVSGVILSRGSRAGVGHVVMDGVPLFSSVLGSFPLGRYPLDYFDQADFTSNFDGNNVSSRSLTGSLHLKSLRIEHGKGFLHTEGGSYGTFRNYAGAGLDSSLAHVTVAAGRSDIFEGVSQAVPASGAGERDKSDMNNVLVRVDKEFGKGVLEKSMFYSNSDEQQDGPGVIQANPRIMGWQDQRNGFIKGETWVAQSHAEYKINAANSTGLRFGFTQNQDRGLIGCIPLPGCGLKTFSMDMSSQLGLVNWQNSHVINLGLPETHLQFNWGVDAQIQHGDSPMNPQRIYSIQNHVISPFGRIEADWRDWFASVDLRSDHYDRYGDPNLFNFTIGKQFFEQTKTWFSLGNGYRQPAVNELLHPLFGSMALKPESQHGGEVGIEWRKDKQDYVSMKAFYQRHSNMMIAAQKDPVSSFQVSNVDQADAVGMELDAGYAWTKQWSSGLSYNYNEIRNSQTNLLVPYRAPHFGKFWTKYHITPALRWYTELNFRTGQWADISNQTYIKGVPRLSTRVEYDVFKNFTTYVRGDNLNDDKTPELYRFYAMGFAAYGGFVFKW